MEQKTTLQKKEPIHFKWITVIIVLMILVVGICCHKTIYERKSLDVWTGQYTFSDTFEHNSGEMYYVVDYELIIYRDGGTYYAELEGNGWFLQTRLLAYIEGDENSIDILFKSSLPGDSLYGTVERYEEIKGIYFEKNTLKEQYGDKALYFRKREIDRQDLDMWMGAYSYSELYKFDDKNVDVRFELIIYKDDGNYYAEFKNTGYSLTKQDYSVLLQSRSLAYIKGNEESIDICFKSTLPGDRLYGISERYNRNELLLTLTYSDSGLQSSWHTLQEEEPVLSESEEKMEGVYFTKIYSRKEEHR